MHSRSRGFSHAGDFELKPFAEVYAVWIASDHHELHQCKDFECAGGRSEPHHKPECDFRRSVDVIAAIENAIAVLKVMPKDRVCASSSVEEFAINPFPHLVDQDGQRELTLSWITDALTWSTVGDGPNERKSLANARHRIAALRDVGYAGAVPACIGSRACITDDDLRLGAVLDADRPHLNSRSRFLDDPAHEAPAADQEHEAPTHRARGHISFVAGRHTESERNRPALDEVHFVVAGVEHVFRTPRLTGTTRVTTTRLIKAERIDFGICPVCLASDASSKEHVPPESLGGGELTLTCERCNNVAGSRLEPHLLDWYEHALRGVTFSGAGTPGHRRGPRILLREDEHGTRGLIFDVGAMDDAVTDVLNAEKFSVRFRIPDVARVKAAVLKSAYIAACAVLGGVPLEGRAKQIRAELAAAIEAPPRFELTLGPIAQSLRIGRTGLPAAPGEIWLVADTSGDDVRFMLRLADILMVDWPLEPFSAVRTDQGSGLAWHAEP